MILDGKVCLELDVTLIAQVQIISSMYANKIWRKKPLETCTFLLTNIFVYTCTGICYTETKTCEKVNDNSRKEVEL